MYGVRSSIREYVSVPGKRAVFTTTSRPRASCIVFISSLLLEDASRLTHRPLLPSDADRAISAPREFRVEPTLSDSVKPASRFTLIFTLTLALTLISIAHRLAV